MEFVMDYNFKVYIFDVNILVTCLYIFEYH